MQDYNVFMQKWVGNNLPKEHINLNTKSKKGITGEILRKRVLHPIRRHLARYYAKYVLRKIGVKIVAVTGSAGKTTTKEMIASVLGQKYKIKKTLANIDPVYNIPQTLLHTPPWTKQVVLEMGIEFPGEMDFYLWLVQPDIGVFTNVNWTHTEFFKNISGVFNEKSKLIKSLSKKGLAILNYDDVVIRNFGSKLSTSVIWYGKNKSADIKASKIRITNEYKTKFLLEIGKNSIDIELNLLGEHFVSLALAAASVGKANRMKLEEIKSGLESVKSQKHRMVPQILTNGAILIDDSYNSNPYAVIASINLLSNKKFKERRKILVAGEMKELGNYEEKGHRLVGEHAANKKIDVLLTIGKSSKYTLDEAQKKGLKKENLHFFSKRSELERFLTTNLQMNDVVLIKGSRKLNLDKLVKKLKKNY